MSLFSEIPFSNVTTYRVEFTRKETERRKKCEPPRDYADPIAGPFEEHILPYRKHNLQPRPARCPEPREYWEKVLDRDPGAAKYLKNPPWGPLDFDAVDRLYDHENRTVYMVDYCRLGDFASGRVPIKPKAAPDLRDFAIPLTTQGCSYRRPDFFGAVGIKALKIARTPDHLGPNEKVREILQVKTGDSEYMDAIGKTGQEIIEGKLHGDVNVRPKFSQDELLRAKLIRRE